MIGGEDNKGIPFHAEFAHLINQRPYAVIQPQCKRFVVRSGVFIAAKRLRVMVEHRILQVQTLLQ